MDKFSVAPELRDEIIVQLDKRGPFVAHGKDLYVKWDEIAVETFEADSRGKIVINILLKNRGIIVARMGSKPMTPGSTLTLYGLAGDIELPLSFV